MNYIDFLRNKMAVSHETGFEVSPEELTPTLYPRVKYTVRWAVKGGCRFCLVTELNHDYWRDGLSYLREAKSAVTAPTLFDLMTME